MNNKLTVVIDGVPWHTYGVEYRHDGKVWGFDLIATSEDDAKRRLRSIAGNAEVLGKIEGCIPAAPGAGLWVRLVCWFKNLARSR